MFRYSNRSKYKTSNRYARRRGGDGSIRSVLLFALLLLAGSLLLLDKTQNRPLAKWRQVLLDNTTPLLEVSAIPAGYIRRSFERLNTYYDIHGELTRLQHENKKLKSVEWNIAELRQRNSQLKALLNSVEEPRMRYVSGRVISGSPGLFGKNLIVNLGRSNGIGSGFAVINADGVVGRTVDTGARTSRVLLLTDPLSRIPVVIGKNSGKAVIIGDGTPFPKIEFLSRGARIYEGDFVFTSGHGGELPKGLRIGIVKKISGKFRIAPRARLEGTEYVSVLYFEKQGMARR